MASIKTTPPVSTPNSEACAQFSELMSSITALSPEAAAVKAKSLANPNDPTPIIKASDLLLDKVRAIRSRILKFKQRPDHLAGEIDYAISNLQSSEEITAWLKTPEVKLALNMFNPPKSMPEFVGLSESITKNLANNSRGLEGVDQEKLVRLISLTVFSTSMVVDEMVKEFGGDNFAKFTAPQKGNHVVKEISKIYDKVNSFLQKLLKIISKVKLLIDKNGERRKEKKEEQRISEKIALARQEAINAIAKIKKEVPLNRASLKNITPGEALEKLIKEATLDFSKTPVSILLPIQKLDFAENLT
jgi:hypothetical protein